jgi:hypothetical protein
MTRACVVVGCRHEGFENGARVRRIPIAACPQADQLPLQSSQRFQALPDPRDVPLRIAPIPGRFAFGLGQQPSRSWKRTVWTSHPTYLHGLTLYLLQGFK